MLLDGNPISPRLDRHNSYIVSQFAIKLKVFNNYEAEAPFLKESETNEQGGDTAVHYLAKA